MKLFVAVFETEIPNNLGAIIRSSACLGKEIELIIIDPISFDLHSRLFRRTKMDYNVNIIRCNSFNDFLLKFSKNRKILFTPHSDLSLSKFLPQENDILFFGKESTGVPVKIAEYMNLHYKIPMNNNCRSLNLATSVSIVLYHTFLYISYV